MIIVVSDTNMGYSTPQIPSFAESLGRYFDCRVVILEPDIPNRPLTDTIRRSTSCAIQRIPTPESAYASEACRVQYTMMSADIINGFKPRVVVSTCAFSAGVVNYLTYKPQLSILYALELGMAYGPIVQKEVKDACASGKIQLVIHPEPNRRDIDKQLTGDVPTLLVLNALADPTPSVLPWNKRNGRILITATHNSTVLADYYKSLYKTPIDFCGTAQDGLTRGLPSHVRYLGVIPHDDLHALRSTYAWSLVMWNPSNDNQKYAAPNKLFESIAAGCPVICAPHPQCRYVAEELGCGIVARSWSLSDINRAIGQAVSTSGYHRYVEKCVHATKTVLNREVQFEIVTRWLKENGYDR